MKSRSDEQEVAENYGSPRVSRQWKDWKEKESKLRKPSLDPPDVDERTPLLAGQSPSKDIGQDEDSKGESVLADLRKELEMDSHRISLDDLYNRFETDPESVSQAKNILFFSTKPLSRGEVAHFCHANDILRDEFINGISSVTISSFNNFRSNHVITFVYKQIRNNVISRLKIHDGILFMNVVARSHCNIYSGF